MITGLLTLVTATVIVGLVLLIIHLFVDGLPPRGAFRAWRIRRQWEGRVMERALEVQAAHPHLEFRCKYYPEYPALCGERCSFSIAARQLRDESMAIESLLSGRRS